MSEASATAAPPALARVFDLPMGYRRSHARRGRMLELMATWCPNRSDRQAGITRNDAFYPALPVVVSSVGRISCAIDVVLPGEPSLLFTIVPPDVSSGPLSRGTSTG
jgi:hypothetical protein